MTAARCSRVEFPVATREARAGEPPLARELETVFLAEGGLRGAPGAPSPTWLLLRQRGLAMAREACARHGSVNPFIRMQQHSRAVLGTLLSSHHPIGVMTLGHG